MIKKIIISHLFFQSFFLCASDIYLGLDGEHNDIQALSKLLCYSCDDFLFEIPQEVIRLSSLFKTAVEYEKSFEPVHISLSLINSNILKQIIDLCRIYLKKDKIILNLSFENLFELYEASNYLDIYFLQNLIAQKISSQILASSEENLDTMVSRIEDLIIQGALYYFHPNCVLKLFKLKKIDRSLFSWSSLLNHFFPEEYRRSLDFSDEVEGCDDYKIFFYSLRYPIYTLEYTLNGHNSWVTDATFSADGKKIITISRNRVANIWDTETAKLLKTSKSNDNWYKTAKFTLDGSHVFIVLRNNSYLLWDFVNNKFIRKSKNSISLSSPHIFTPDSLMYVSDSYAGTVKIWHSKTHELLQTLNAHDDFVTAASFSPDGKRILSASWDLTAKVWKRLF